MKHIEQDPRDYRAEPLAGEPVFVPGALKRVAINTVVFVGMAALCIPVYLAIDPFAQVFGRWLAGLFFQ